MGRLDSRRALVAGGAGFVGASLVRTLLREGADVTVVARPTTDLWRLDGVRDRVTLRRADLLGPDLAATVAASAPDVVFNLAVFTGHPETPAQRAQALAANTAATHALLEASLAAGVARFVQAGSFLEYGPRDRPLREDDALRPVTFRGATKAAATLLCGLFARAHGLHAVTLRVFTVYGPFEPEGRLVPTAIRAALGGGELDLAAGGGSRDMVYAGDVADAFARAAAADVPPGEAINVGSGEACGNERLVAAISGACGGRLRVNRGAYPDRGHDTAFCAADIGKARSLLGWSPAHTLAEGVRETVAWFAARAPRPV